MWFGPGGAAPAQRCGPWVAPGAGRGGRGYPQVMHLTRIYTGDDGQSHFEDLDIPLTPTPSGAISGAIPAAQVFFRDTTEGPELMDFHVAPRRQFVVHLCGRVELECGDGSRRQFGVGDVFLADDTTGQGHISREIEGPRRQVFIPLADGVDPSRWKMA